MGGWYTGTNEIGRVLDGGGIEWQLNGSPFTPEAGIQNPVTRIELTNFSSNPTVFIRPQSGFNVRFPAINGSTDTIGWTGSGTFTLGSNTFDDFVPGSYSNGVNYSGGGLTLVVTTIPEPSTMALLGSLLVMMTLTRRRG